MPRRKRKKPTKQADQVTPEENEVGEPLEYFNPSAPGSYAGASTFQRHHPQYKLDNLYDTLSKYRSYTLHKSARRRFPRNRTYTGGIDSLWDIDLTDMQKFADQNDGYRWIFLAICVFSKKAWAIPLKNKTGPTLASAWQQLFEMTERRPQSVRSDKGGEFKNGHVMRFFRKHNINYYTSQNEETKANFVERFQRTLKTKMWRFFSHHGTRRWVDVLEDLIQSYNATYHRSIGMTPNQVTKENEPQVFRRLYKKPLQKSKFKSYKVGDTVRLIATRTIFDKGYEPNWTEAVYVISEKIDRQPPVYRVKDLNNEEIVGVFYGYELQKVDISDNVFTVEKVLKTRTRQGKKEYFVKWFGYPKSFNSWTTGEVFDIK